MPARPQTVSDAFWREAWRFHLFQIMLAPPTFSLNTLAQPPSRPRRPESEHGARSTFIFAASLARSRPRSRRLSSRRALRAARQVLESLSASLSRTIAPLDALIVSQSTNHPIGCPKNAGQCPKDALAHTVATRHAICALMSRRPSTTLADFSRARDSQITFSVTHGWSAFWRGRPWLAGRRIGETSSDVGSSRFWTGWVTKHGDKCARSTCRD